MSMPKHVDKTWSSMNQSRPAVFSVTSRWCQRYIFWSVHTTAKIKSPPNQCSFSNLFYAFCSHELMWHESYLSIQDQMHILPELFILLCFRLCTSKNNSCPREMGDAGASATESISQASKQSCRPEPVSSFLRTLTVHGDMSVCVIYSSFCQMVKVMHHCKEAMWGREALSSILTESTCVSVQHTDLKYFVEMDCSGYTT